MQRISKDCNIEVTKHRLEYERTLFGVIRVMTLASTLADFMLKDNFRGIKLRIEHKCMLECLEDSRR